MISGAKSPTDRCRSALEGIKIELSSLRSESRRATPPSAISKAGLTAVRLGCDQGKGYHYIPYIANGTSVSACVMIIRSTEQRSNVLSSQTNQKTRTSAVPIQNRLREDKRREEKRRLAVCRHHPQGWRLSPRTFCKPQNFPKCEGSLLGHRLS